MSKPGIVYVTAEVDPAKTVVAYRLPCLCPLYKEDLPLGEWRCEHGSWAAVTNGEEAT